jgi:hypothetical protein
MNIEINCGFFVIKINSNGVMQWRENLWYPLLGACVDPRADVDGRETDNSLVPAGI